MNDLCYQVHGISRFPFFAGNHEFHEITVKNHEFHEIGVEHHEFHEFS